MGAQDGLAQSIPQSPMSACCEQRDNISAFMGQTYWQVHPRKSAMRVGGSQEARTPLSPLCLHYLPLRTPPPSLWLSWDGDQGLGMGSWAYAPMSPNTK